MMHYVLQSSGNLVLLDQYQYEIQNDALGYYQNIETQ